MTIMEYVSPDKPSQVNHPHTLLTPPFAVPIDNELVPLITELWSKGVVTIACCQGGLWEDEFNSKLLDGYVAFEEKLYPWGYKGAGKIVVEALTRRGYQITEVGGSVNNDKTLVVRWKAE